MATNFVDQAVTRFKKMKQEVESAKTELAELQGRKKQLMERLKTEFDVDSVEDAVALQEELKVTIANMLTKFDAEVQILGNKLGM